MQDVVHIDNSDDPQFLQNSANAVEYNLQQKRTIHFRKFHDTVPLDKEGSSSKRKRLFGAQRQHALKAEPESAETPKSEHSSPRKPKLPNSFESFTRANAAFQDPKPFLRSQSSSSLPEESVREAKAILIESKPHHERSQSLVDSIPESWQQPQASLIGSTSQAQKPIGQFKLEGRSLGLPSIGEPPFLAEVWFLLHCHISPAAVRLYCWCCLANFLLE